MSKATGNSARSGYAKILEAWERPSDAGDPVGCVATSFTFSPDFFETECLGRFLGLDSVPEDGATYFVEREEKLAQLACAAALVDQHHVQGSRNLRWDLLPARISPGILHAKISLLLWSHHARLVVASANLTPDGYRHNHEVFGVLDYFPDGEAPLPVLWEFVEYLKTIAGHASARSSNSIPALQRWLRLLERVRKSARTWGANHPRDRFAQVRIVPVLSGPKRPSVLQSLKDNWPDGAAPSRAYVISPFFDPPDAPNKPARELWKLLNGRGDKSVQYDVESEEVNDAGRHHLLLHAPFTLRDEHPKDSTCEVRFQCLKLEENRPLHAKCLWLENRNWSAYLMGSSNFTSPGLSVGKVANLEANLAYFVHHGKNPQANRALNSSWLESSPVPRNFRLQQEPTADAGQDAAALDAVLLPRQFGDATFASGSKNQFYLEFTLHGHPPAGWVLLHENKDETLYGEREWLRSGRKSTVRLPWNDSRPPSTLRVRWKNSPGWAWWPVNVADAHVLPPPDVLRELSLDELVAILTSASPLHQVMGRILQQKKERAGNSADVLDPHRRVDTSQFLIQRTRRVTWALNAIRQRLELPAASQETLQWRLHGPVGVMKFAEAINREAKTSQERCFLFAELALTLGRVELRSSPHCLSKREIRAALHSIIHELRAQALKSVSRTDPIRRYAVRAFKEATA